MLAIRRGLCGSRKLRNVILLVKDLDESASFYSEAIGLPVKSRTFTSVELDAGGISIVLKVSSRQII